MEAVQKVAEAFSIQKQKQKQKKKAGRETGGSKGRLDLFPQSAADKEFRGSLGSHDEEERSKKRKGTSKAGET